MIDRDRGVNGLVFRKSPDRESDGTSQVSWTQRDSQAMPINEERDRGVHPIDLQLDGAVFPQGESISAVGSTNLFAVTPQTSVGIPGERAQVPALRRSWLDGCQSSTRRQRLTDDKSNRPRPFDLFWESELPLVHASNRPRLRSGGFPAGRGLLGGTVLQHRAIAGIL